MSNMVRSLVSSSLKVKATATRDSPPFDGELDPCKKMLGGGGEEMMTTASSLLWTELSSLKQKWSQRRCGASREARKCIVRARYCYHHGLGIDVIAAFHDVLSGILEICKDICEGTWMRHASRECHLRGGCCRMHRCGRRWQARHRRRAGCRRGAVACESSQVVGAIVYAASLAGGREACSKGNSHQGWTLTAST